MKKLVQLFTHLGMKTSSASDGVEAFQKLSTNKGEYHVVFTDIEMPKMDGITLARRSKATLILNRFH